MSKRRKKSRNESGQPVDNALPPNLAEEKQPSIGSLALTRILWAVNLLIAVLRAVQLISISYPWLVALAYLLFALSLIEVFREPSLKKWQRVVGAVIVIAATVWFMVGSFSKAPLETLAYTTPGDHSTGTVIGGISWNSHFTDLRMDITNSITDDYEQVDVVIKPDVWTYKAAITDNSPYCQLLPIKSGSDLQVVDSGKGGATEIKMIFNGTTYDAYDNAGDIFTTFASEGGYRLRCTTLPSKYTVHVVFALVDISPFNSPNGNSENTLQQRDETLTVGGKPFPTRLREINSKSPFDFLGSKPSTKNLTLSGTYKKGIKPFVISGTVDVNGKQLNF